MRRRIKKQKGQGMTEYIIIIVLIAIVLIFVVGQYGSTLDRIIRGSDKTMEKNVQPSGGWVNTRGGGTGTGTGTGSP